MLPQRASSKVILGTSLVLAAQAFTGVALGQQQLASTSAPPQTQTDAAVDRIVGLVIKAKEADDRHLAATRFNSAAEQASACIRSFLPQAPTMSQEQKQAAIADCKAKAGLQ